MNSALRGATQTVNAKKHICGPDPTMVFIFQLCVILLLVTGASKTSAKDTPVHPLSSFISPEGPF